MAVNHAIEGPPSEGASTALASLTDQLYHQTTVQAAAVKRRIATA